MLPFNLLDHNRHSDPNCSQEGSILPITNSIKSGRGIAISIGGRSKGERSSSREHRKPIFPKDPSLNCSEGFRGGRPLERR